MGSQAKVCPDTKKEEWVLQMNGDARKGQHGRPSASKSFLAAGLALLAPILMPMFHMQAFLSLWSDTKHQVDKKSCTCSCWDTVFKGPYETGVAKFKHVYFNSTWNTFKMWAITVTAIILLYESLKNIIQLGSLSRLRWTMLSLFLISLHSHYYAWWVHWGYWNDEFYDQWNHQAIFTVSEFLCTSMVLLNIDSKKHLRPLPLLIIANISLFHILSSSWDQFVYSVIRGQGKLHQVIRDVLLMATDILHTCIALNELKRYSKQECVSIIRILSSRNNFALLSAITALLTLGYMITW